MDHDRAITAIDNALAALGRGGYYGEYACETHDFLADAKAALGDIDAVDTLETRLRITTARAVAWAGIAERSTNAEVAESAAADCEKEANTALETANTLKELYFYGEHLKPVKKQAKRALKAARKAVKKKTREEAGKEEERQNAILEILADSRWIPVYEGNLAECESAVREREGWIAHWRILDRYGRTLRKS